MNNYAKTVTNFEETADQYSWLYLHKSQYALILVVCIAFCVVYRKMFRNIVTYLLSLGVLIYSLYLSNTYASMVAAVLIFVGQFLDYLIKAKWWKKLVAIVIIGVPGIIICTKLYELILDERDLFTLGNRILLWSGSIETIKQNPNGIMNFIMGIDRFVYYTSKEGWLYSAYNCHNVFLNHILRYSIAVGIIFLSLFILLLLTSIKKTPIFLTFSIWGALLIPWCMDYSMTCAETSFTLLFIYILFFLNSKR